MSDRQDVSAAADVGAVSDGEDDFAARVARREAEKNGGEKKEGEGEPRKDPVLECA